MALDSLIRSLAHWAEAPPPPWRPASSVIMLVYHLPILLQCLLLHPSFAPHDRQLRWVRLGLVPINFRLSFKIMSDFCFVPLVSRGPCNLSLATWACHLAMKSIEWGLCATSSDEMYRIRPEFEKPKRHSTTQVDGWAERIGWTLDQMLSMRGIKYGWGCNVAHKNSGLIRTLQLLLITHVVQMLGLAGCVLVRDAGTPLNALTTLGVPHFPGLNILAEGLATLAFGLLVICGMEYSLCYLALVAHLVEWINRCIPLPDWLVGFWDPRLFVPLYNAPHTATSLAWFWGKGWHQSYRRGFLVCGARPASRAASLLGLGPKAQRACGLFGSFLVSGIIHEVAIQCVARPTHPAPHVHFKSYPASLIYFLLQPLGILIEPYIIPRIPKVLGGGWLWVLIFTLWSATPFRKQYVQYYRVIDHLYPPLSEWNPIGFILPIKLMNW